MIIASPPRPDRRPTRRRLAGVALAATVLVALAGCAAPAASTGTGSASGSAGTDADAAATGYTTPRTMPDGKGSGQPDGVFPRTVVHFAGTTAIPAAPQRVAVISTGQADSLLTLGIVPVASTAADGAAVVPDYLTRAFPEDADALAAVAPLGDRISPDIESVAAAKPDLILMNVTGKDAASLYASLSAIAPTVATQGTGLYWKQDLLLLADAVGRTQQAASWLDSYQSDAAAFGAGLADRPTVSFLRSSADRIRVFGVASFAGSVAEDAGLPRPTAQDFTDETSRDISEEQIDLAEGDHVFAGVQGGDDTALTGLPLWPTLQAVEDDAVTFVDDDVFYLNTGPTAARSVLEAMRSALG
ncbi:iron-siderophore ABC transporter substrate-binding protein [Clavibacter michiganensis]|uniref:ABC transporter substrate-binding protein n=1 Tax=Clavibacter michiganensis TaxID=28447 RepID=UPI001365CAA4|nr:iron-siderophore ABC transporter substrate-binding protein [Clavibacter michiganensis]MDO4042266.1 iron-siderophore ABC transporter substrate-binding protein [Clavibacter michiganensis]MDO4060488.1 iron-siderophore ABC transporter substrate-binding protein [Clavibacter michiganensis]MDO4078920.1 iron-siderophore ABC transporter substrate-binding protein [Clavibacter michiganensis]MDO4094636.1 iron-siderophore ABC transporter substrate-binding protein [Clavibacter michiganensis]MDO4103603.1 